MNIMVTGSGGQLGSEFRAMAPDYAKWNFFFFSHEDLDVADDEMVAEAMSRCGCDVVINCAAFTSVDKAESDPARSFRVNRDGAGVLARCAAARSAFLVHFSTYNVFDGESSMPYRETDKATSHGMNAQAKLAGEDLVRSFASSYLVIRAGWLYSPFGDSSVRLKIKKV